MILTIDTEKESGVRLRQIAQFLEELAGHSSASRSDDMVVEASSDMFSMFGGDDEPAQEPVKRPSSFSVQPY